MYDKEDMSEVSGIYTCKFFMESVAQYLKENKWPFGNFDLKTNNVNASVRTVLEKELGLKYSGKRKQNFLPPPLSLVKRFSHLSQFCFHLLLVLLALLCAVLLFVRHFRWIIVGKSNFRLCVLTNLLNHSEELPLV